MWYRGEDSPPGRQGCGGGVYGGGGGGGRGPGTSQFVQLASELGRAAPQLSAKRASTTAAVLHETLPSYGRAAEKPAHLLLLRHHAAAPDSVRFAA